MIEPDGDQEKADGGCDISDPAGCLLVVGNESFRRIKGNGLNGGGHDSRNRRRMGSNNVVPSGSLWSCMPGPAVQCIFNNT